MNLKDFGARMKRARELRGLTQEEVIERTGIKDRTGLSAIENGKRDLGAVELAVFAEALEVPITFFFNDALKSETDKEAALLEWFRMLPEDRQQRVFEFTEDQAARVPRVVGDQRDPSKSTPAKGRRKDDGHNSR